MHRNLMIFRSGDIDKEVLDGIMDGIQRIFGVGPISGGSFNLPEESLDRNRDQYLTYPIFEHLHQRRKDHNTMVLGILKEDLYVPGMSFVFGQANKKMGIALVSLKRLYPDYLGKVSDPSIVKERALKESIHEVGHLLGLSHCSNSRCVMFFSNCLEDTDKKKEKVCGGCEMRL